MPIEYCILCRILHIFEFIGKLYLKTKNKY